MRLTLKCSSRKVFRRDMGDRPVVWLAGLTDIV
jgi:hypothetical protein